MGRWKKISGIREKERKKTNVFNRKTYEATLLNEPILCKLKDADKAHSWCTLPGLFKIDETEMINIVCFTLIKCFTWNIDGRAVR